MVKPVMVSELRRFALLPGELVSSITTVDNGTHLYDIETIEKEGFETKDSVLLDIVTSTEPCILVAGNQVRVTTIAGCGRLTMVDLATGTQRSIQLESGTRVEIPAANTLYFYENTAPVGDLLIRDDCDGFSSDHELAAESVVGSLLHPLV